MKSLKEIKAVIFKTDCKDLICEGLCCSEPIITKDENGLIDNYFIYACDKKGTKYSKPLAAFGVYSEEGKTAYKKVSLDFEDREYCDDNPANDIEVSKAYDSYVALYPQVRNLVYTECDDTQKKMLAEYVTALKTISGSVLWEFYNKLSPMFFEWVKRQCES
jgi:hypothetical protein